MTGSWPRPAGVARQAVVLAVLVLAFLGISRTTGSGWVVVLVCGVVGCLVVATVSPALAVARASVEVGTPGDGTVGRALPVLVSVRGGGALKLRLADPPGTWVGADSPADGEVLVTPERRGVFDGVAVELRSAGPLGLVWWARRFTVDLASPLEVGPRPVEMGLPDVSRAGGWGPDATFRGRAGHELVRSVREYVPGDPLRLVHWGATARIAQTRPDAPVMVKELEDPELPRLAVVVDLRGAAEAAEAAASQAAGLVLAALRDSVPVTLLTLERVGPVVRPVISPVDVGRRLARAVPGEPPEGPLPDGAVTVRIGGSSGPPTGWQD